MDPHHPKFSIWAASCIAVGLLIAYLDGVGMQGILGSALLMSSLICAVLAITWVYGLWKRKSRPDK